MEKKYRLTDDTINVDGRTLYRIEALKDFNNVKKGDKGGFVEKEETYPNMVIVGYMTTQRSMTMQKSMAGRQSVARRKSMTMRKSVIME